MPGGVGGARASLASTRFGRGPEETERYRHRASGLPQLPVAERRRETEQAGCLLQVVVSDNRPDTGPAARTRKRADAVR